MRAAHVHNLGGSKMDKFKNYTRQQVAYAIDDCHKALIAGEYSPDHKYGRKLWAEIDALRARGAALDKGAK